MYRWTGEELGSIGLMLKMVIHGWSARKTVFDRLEWLLQACQIQLTGLTDVGHIVVMLYSKYMRGRCGVECPKSYFRRD